MKSPLNYQITEYDCGPTTMMNAMAYLFKREEVPPDIIKHITLYCLDSYNEKGEFGKNGTSHMAMMFLSDWLNQFGKVKRFPIRSECLTGTEVRLGQNSKLVAALQQGGCAAARVMYGCWHYVLLTGVSDGEVFLFDPYYRKQPFREKGAVIVKKGPCEHNRRVSFEMMNNTGRGLYAFGPVETREAILLCNTDRQKALSEAIEYFI